MNTANTSRNRPWKASYRIPPSPTNHFKRSIMTTSTEAERRLLESMHDGARDRHLAGFIDKRRMRKFEALRLAPIPAYGKDRIKELRERHRISQAVLAAVLNASLSTVRQWEIGDKQPSGPSLKLLNLLDRRGMEGLV
jgi:putative transcriptional regulator